MSTEVVASGVDAGVRSPDPDTSYPDLPMRAVRPAPQASVFVALPLAVVPDVAVTQALLSFWITVTSQNVNEPLQLRGVDGDWDPETLTYDNQPAVRATTAVGNTGAASATPKLVTVDVTALVQEIYAGAPNYGFRLNAPDVGATEPSVLVEGFASTRVAEPWRLEVTTLDRPTPPAVVSPNGGEVNGPTWPCRLEHNDPTGETDFGGVQVQVDPDATSPYQFTSDVVTDVETPELDLADTAYTGITVNGGSTFWRGQTFSADGVPSGYGPWAKVTRVDDPTLVIDRPVDNVLASAKPRIAGHVSGTNPTTGQPFKIAAFQIWVFDARGRERYDSGRQPNKAADETKFAWQIPFRAPGFVAYHQGQILRDSAKVVFPDDGDYTIRIRVWRAGKKQWGGSDDPPYLQAKRDVVFAPDGVLVPPDVIAAGPAPDGPGALLTWTLPLGAPTPDFFTISRNGIRTTNLEVPPIAGNGTTSPLTYEHIDRGALPNTLNDYTIRSGRNDDDDGPVESAKSQHTYTENPVEGVWICSEHGNVKLRRTDTSGLAYRDKATTVALPYRADDIDIITAQTGLEGPVTGFLSDLDGDVDDARAILRDIHDDKTAEVYLVWATMAALGTVRNLSVTPDDEKFVREQTRPHAVSLDFRQTGEFDQAG